MIEIVSCEIMPGRGSRAALYILANDIEGQLRVNALVNVNLNDEPQRVVAIATVGFGSDPVDDRAKITHQFNISASELKQIIERTTPEIAQAFLAQFSQILLD